MGTVGWTTFWYVTMMIIIDHPCLSKMNSDQESQLVHFALSYLQGGPQLGGVDTSIATFVNHGCQATYNIHPKLAYHEMNIMDCDPLIPCMTCYDSDTDPYDPFWERQYPMWDCQSNIANRDIEMGEELLDEYMCMGGTKYLMESIAELQIVCSGGVGVVTTYEEEVLA
jgi:hypothetical protein